MNDTDIKVTLGLDSEDFHVKVRRVGAELQKASNEFERMTPAVNRLDRDIRQSNHSFRDMVLTLGMLRFAALNLYDVFGRLPMHIQKNAGELERMQVLMKGLSSETTDAARAMEGMRNFNFVVGMAKTTPYEISALSDSFVKLKAAGIDPTNGSLKILTDSVARFGGNSEILKRATVAISQMAGKGVISMEELRQQLGEAVPTAMRAMADGMGVSMAKLTKLVSSGLLVAEPAIDAMLRRLEFQNRGAAAEMMNTWVGMTAQMKTEWQLTSKAISDAGLGNAMKSIVGELTELMRDEGFQSWARDFGKNLGEIARGALSLGKTLVEFSSYIKAAAIAWGAYLAVTKLIAPMGNSISAGMKSLRNEFAITNSAISQSVEKYRASEVLKADTQRDALRRSVETSTAMIQNLRTEAISAANIQEQRVQAHAAMISKIEAYDTRYAQLQRKYQKGDATGRDKKALAGMADQAQDMDRLREKASSLNNVIVAQGQAMSKTDAQIRALNSSIVASDKAMAGQNAALARSITMYGLKERAAAGAALAVRGFSAVVGALGGPVGVGILVIAGLVAWWQKTKAAADEAAQAQIRASRAMSMSGDVELLNKKLKDKEEELRNAQRDSQAGTRGGIAYDGRKLSEKETEERNARVAALTKEIEEIAKDRERANVNLQKAESELVGSRYMTDLRHGMRDIQNKNNELIQVLRNEENKLIDKLKNDGVKEEDIQKKLAPTREGHAKAILAGYEAQINYVRTEHGKLAEKLKSASGTEREGITTAMASMVEEIEGLGNMADRYRKIKEITLNNGKNPFGDDEEKAKKPKKSALQRLAEQIAQDGAALQEQLNNLDETGRKATTVSDKIMALNQAFAADKAKGLKPDANLLKKLIDQVKVNAEQRDQLKETEKAVRYAQQLVSLAEGLDDRLAEARQKIKDPLGAGDFSRKETDRIAKMLAQTPKAFELAAKQTGQSVEGFTASIRASVATLDISDEVQKIARQTSQLESTVTEQTRSERAARLASENADIARRMENAYAYYQGIGVQEKELEALRKTIDENNAARARRFQIDTQHPIIALAKQWNNFEDNFANATVSWANRAADAFVQMATTGKASFKDLTVSILADMARLHAQKAFSQLIQLGMNFIGGFSGGGNAAGGITGSGSGGLGISASASSNGSLGSINYSPFANGGIMTEFGSLPLRKYANGGVARSPQVAIYGEGKTPEAYVPLPDGRTIPVTMSGGSGGGGQPVVNISIVVNSDGDEDQQANVGSSDPMAVMANRIKEVVREELLTQKRQGGILAS